MGRGSRPQIHHCIEKDAVNLPATAHIAGPGRWVQRWSPAWLATAAGAAPAGAQYRGCWLLVSAAGGLERVRVFSTLHSRPSSRLH